MSFSRALTLAGRNFKEIRRDTLSLGFLFGLPVFMLVLFYFIFHKLTPQFEMRYLAPAMTGFGQAFISLFSGILITTDRSSSFMARLYATRTRPSEFIIGYALAMVPFALIQTLIFLTAAVVIDVSFFSPYLFTILPLSAVTCAFFIAAGLLLGALCNEKSVGGVASVIVMGQSVLSGMWFPTEGLEGGFMTVMNVLPFKNVTVIMQNAAAGIFTFDGVLRPLIIVCAYTVVLFTLATVVFRSKMTK